MRSLPLVVALAGAAAFLPGQANCAGPGQLTTIATQSPFAGGWLYGHPNYPNPPGPTYIGLAFVYDLTLNTTIGIERVDFDFYDAGGLVNLGNGGTVTSPNQVGATTTVDFYVIPLTSWVGNETNPAVWGLLGTGTLTIGQPHAASPALFNPPITLPAGLWGCMMVVNQTTSGPNPGPLHPMLDQPTTMPPPPQNTVLSITNLQFQREAWTATLAPATHLQNIAWHYRVLQDGANWTSFGAGCGSPAPTLALGAMPLVGGSLDLRASNAPATSPFAFWLVGFTVNAPGLPLDGFGMPGCSLHLPLGSPIASTITGVSGGSASLPLGIPASPSYSGLLLYAQAALSAPGMNPAGLAGTNAICAQLGLY